MGGVTMPNLGRRARRGLSTPLRMAVDAGGYALGGVLGAVALARGGKAVHPDGVVYDARLVVDGSADAPQGSQLLRTAAEHRAIVRFSRSLGMPKALPDLLGASVRVLEAYGPERHQDFLMVTSVDRPVLHHIFVPATDFQQRPYSSSLPYRAGEERFLVGLLPRADSARRSAHDEYDRLARASRTHSLVFDLAVAPIRGRFRPVAALHVGDRLPDTLDALAFDPLACGGGLEAVGYLNRLRDYAYPLSQAAWGTRGHRADAQEQAAVALRRRARN